MYNVVMILHSYRQYMYNVPMILHSYRQYMNNVLVILHSYRPCMNNVLVILHSLDRVQLVASAAGHFYSQLNNSFLETGWKLKGYFVAAMGLCIRAEIFSHGLGLQRWTVCFETAIQGGNQLTQFILTSSLIHSQCWVQIKAKPCCYGWQYPFYFHLSCNRCTAMCMLDIVHIVNLYLASFFFSPFLLLVKNGVCLSVYCFVLSIICETSKHSCTV